MSDININQAEIDAYNQSLDFVKYPDTGLPPVEETPVANSVYIQDNVVTSPVTSTIVQAFDNSGYPLPIITEAQHELQRKENFVKAFAGQQVSASQGAPTSSGDGAPSVVSPYMSAMKQKGYLQEKGFFGDQSLTNENKAFGNVVDLAVGITGAARVIKSLSSSGRASRNKYSNYYIYDNERTLLQERSRQIASIGVVPYDMVEEFLYILITVDNYNDMYYISTVVGIPELNNPNIIREPYLILSIKNLYKVGYLANGVASINMQYSTKYNAIAAADHQSSPFSTLQNIAGISGVPASPASFAQAQLAGGLLSSTGVPLNGVDSAFSGISSVASAGGLMNAALGQFPIVNIASNLVGDIVSQIGQITAITSAFSTFGTIPGDLGKLADLASIASLGSLASQTSNLNAMVASTTSILSQSGVSSMGSIVGSLNQMVRQTRDMSAHATQLSNITTLPATIGKKSDITGQMNKVLSMSMSISSLASTITSLVSSIPSPGNIGLAAGVNLAKLGGMAPSGIIAEQTLGQRIPPSVLYKNPQMQAPSFAGKAFFGEASSAQGAIDQVFCKRIGAFPANQSGSGTSSFGLQNFGSFGGDTSLTGMVSNALLGTMTPPTTGILADIVSTKTSNLANLLNVPTTSTMECRRSDHSIPLMIAMASVLVDDTNSPFPTSVHSEGWKLASSVGNDVQRYNPNFLSTCVSSL